MSRSKGNQTFKFGQVIATEIFYFKIHAENEAERLVPDLFLVFKKALYDVKKIVCSLVSITFDSPQLDKQLKQNI